MWPAVLKWLLANLTWLIAGTGTVITVVMNPGGYFRLKRDDGDSASFVANTTKLKLIRDQIQALHNEIVTLQEEVRDLRNEVHLVRLEKIDLEAQIQMLQVENDELKRDRELLRKRLDKNLPLQ